jgi:hypothetical protein
MTSNQIYEILKVWSVILGVTILYWSMFGCSSTKMSNVPSYPFYDRDGNIHRYKERVIMPYEPQLNQYCQQHFEWEKITIIYTGEGIKYIVR